MSTASTVLDNTSRSNKITDCVYWYRAKPDRKFKIGSKDIWNYHKKHYNEKHSLEDEQVIPVKSTASKLKIKKIKTINNVKKNAD